MKKWNLLIGLFALIANFAIAQITTQVNPDGSHTQVIRHGNTSTHVNPNGTHSQVFHHGNTSTKVNPDGSHSQIFHHGNTSIQVNPDGSHTQIFNQGNASTSTTPLQVDSLGQTKLSSNQNPKQFSPTFGDNNLSVTAAPESTTPSIHKHGNKTIEFHPDGTIVLIDHKKIRKMKRKKKREAKEKEKIKTLYPKQE